MIGRRQLHRLISDQPDALSQAEVAVNNFALDIRIGE
jgi:hypothetical protein